MIKTLLLNAFETALNAYLALAENDYLLLAPLIGKTIAVTVKPFNETIYFYADADRIQCLADSVKSPDTHITGTLWSLGLMGVAAKPMRSVFQGDINIEGDAETGRKFQKLFNALDINLESKLSRLTGARLAGRLTRLLQSGRDYGETSVESWRQTLTEFLQDESRDLPARAELDVFYRHVDILRTDCDRLEHRLTRLSQALISPSS
jgi:ubiquinone biosynthesis protein UbiJ